MQWAILLPAEAPVAPNALASTAPSVTTSVAAEVSNGGGVLDVPGSTERPISRLPSLPTSSSPISISTSNAAVAGAESSTKLLLSEGFALAFAIDISKFYQLIAPVFSRIQLRFCI